MHMQLSPLASYTSLQQASSKGAAPAYQHPLYNPSRIGSHVTPPTLRDPALWSAVQEFEAILLQQMVRAMTSTLSGSMFGDGPGNTIFQEMYETELARAMSLSGGIGIAQLLYRQISGGMTL